jgi:uncharacterized phage protein gp47/JayE
MSYTRPTQKEIYSAIRADLFSRFPELDPTLANSMSLAIVSVLTGGVSGNYDYLDFILRQVFPDTATDELLERWANIFGLSLFPAAKSTGSVSAEGTIGAYVPAGAELQTISGTIFALTEPLDFAAASPQIAAIEAVEFGFSGNIAASAQLFFVESLAGVDDFANNETGGTSGGRDRETIDSLRDRLLKRLAAPAKGGALYDYDTWAREATAVTRTFVRNFENAGLYGDSAGLGQIIVYFAMDDAYADGIPLAADITDVQNYINVVKPGGCQVLVTQCVAYPVAFNVTITPNNSTTQQAVEDSLKNAILDYGEVGGTIVLNKFQEAMAAAPGLTSWTINSPVANVDAGTSELHTLGVVTFV